MKYLFFMIIWFLKTEIGSTTSITKKISDVLNDEIIKERVDFLVRNSCDKTISDLPTCSPKCGMKHFTSKIQDGTEHCADTIGILPISKEKLQLYVTVKGNTTYSNGKNTATTTNVELSYTSKGATTSTVVAKWNDKGNITGTESPDDFTITANGEVMNYDLTSNEASNTIIKCESINIEKKQNDLSLFFCETCEGTWTLKVTLKEVVSGAPLPNRDEKYSGTFGTNIFEKLHCDQDKLKVLKFDSDKDKEYFETYKTYSNENNIQEFVKDDNFIKNKFTCVKPEHTLLYYIKDIAKPAREIECKKIEGKWQYVATVPKGDVFVDEPIDYDVNIGVVCMEHKCRTCKNPDQKKAECFVGTNCTIIGTSTLEFDRKTAKTYANYDKCYQLQTNICTQKLVILNNEKIVEIETKNSTDCENGKYLVNQEVVSTISCVDQYSVRTNNLTKSEVPSNMENNTKTDLPVFCNTTGCVCRSTDKEYMAIANKNGTSWLRINSVEFDSENDTWIYSRSIEEDEIAEYELERGRAVRCIPSANAIVGKISDLPNSKTSIVYVVNLVLLLVFTVVTIPGAILFVNARVKKRDARKAAKKDKKKDGQSGEKNDEEKKTEEKKKEA